MPKLYKSLILFLIITLLLLFGAPLVVSFIISSQYPKLLAAVSHNNPRFEIKLVRFERGWFSSHATLALTLKSRWMKIYAQKPNHAHTFILHQTIEAGPILLASTNFPSSQSVINKAIIITRAEDPSLQLRAASLWTFHDDFSTNFTINSMSLSNSKQQLQLVNVAGELYYRSPLQKASLHVTIGSGNFSHKTIFPDGSIHESIVYFDGIRSNGDYEQHDDLWYGTRSLQADRIMFATDDRTIFNAHNFDATVTHQYHTQTSTFDVDYSVQSILSHGVNVGPAYIHFSISDINNQALHRLLQQIAQGPLPKENNALNHLIQQGLNIQLKMLKIDTDQDADTAVDKLEATADLRIKPFSAPVNIVNFMQHCEGQGQFSFPKSFLYNVLLRYYARQPMLNSLVRQQSPQQQAQQTLDQWINNKMLKQTLSRLTLNWQFSDQQLTINGLPPNFNQPTSTEPGTLPGNVKPTPEKITPMPSLNPQ